MANSRATPETAAHQAPPSLGFSRQEQWSGLPFPAPMHESEKWKWSHSVVSDSSRPPGLQPTRLLHPWDFPGKSTGVGCHCLLWSAETIFLILSLTKGWSLIKQRSLIIFSSVSHILLLFGFRKPLPFSSPISENFLFIYILTCKLASSFKRHLLMMLC